MAHDNINLTLFVWRQTGANAKGGFKSYPLVVNTHMSFLEMLDVLNNKLIEDKDADGPIAFEHDCREGICGACSLVINGRPHGSMQGTTA